MNANEKLVREFFGCWDTDFPESFDKYLHPEIEWYNSSFPTAYGIPACKDLMRSFFNFWTTFNIEFKTVLAGGDAVMTERVDHLIPETGSPVEHIEILGSFRIVDGKIRYWYDYFNAVPYQYMLTP